MSEKEPTFLEMVEAHIKYLIARFAMWACGGPEWIYWANVPEWDDFLNEGNHPEAEPH